MDRPHTLVLCKVYWCFTALLALATAVIGGVAMILDFDLPAGGYFDSHASVALLLIPTILMAIGAVLAPCLTLRSDTELFMRPVAASSVATRCLSLLIAGQTIVSGVLTLIGGSSDPATSSYAWFGAVAAIASAVYFAFSITKAAASHTSAIVLLGLLPIAWSLLVIADTYFDMSSAANTPITLATLFGFACVALLMTTELRIFLYEPAPRMAMGLRGMVSFIGISAGTMLIFSVYHFHDATILGRGITLLLAGLFALVRMAEDAFHPLPADDPTDDVPSYDPSSDAGDETAAHAAADNEAAAEDGEATDASDTPTECQP